MKDKRLHIYCSTAFLVFVFRKQVELTAEGELARNLFSLLRKSEVFLDADSSEGLRKRMPIEILLANPTMGYTPALGAFKDIANREQRFFHQEAQPTALFLLDAQEDECQRIEEEFGVVCISIQSILKANFLFSWHLEPIRRKNTPIEWTFLERYRHPHNALILSDNYLFSQFTSINTTQDILVKRIEKNLMPILRALLPIKLTSQTFHLAIIFVQDEDEGKALIKARKENTRFTDHLKSLEKVGIAVQAILQKLYDVEYFPKQINLQLIKRLFNSNRSLTHDRHILTNYLLVSSGYGFALSSTPKDLSTTVSAFPITYLTRKFKGYGSAEIDNDSEMVIWQQYQELLDVFNEVQQEKCIVWPPNGKCRLLG